MKNVIKCYFFLLLFLLKSIVGFAQVQNAQLLAKLGKPLYDFIAKSEKVEPYLLNGGKHDTTKAGFAGFAVVKKGALLIPKAQKELLSVMLMDSTYTWDEHIKKCE